MDIQTALQLLFQGSQLFRQIAGVIERRPHLHERANDEDAHLNGLRAVENIGRYNRIVFGEGAREDGREFQPEEVVTICDHLRLLTIGQEKSEIGWKTIRIALYGLVQRLGHDAVQLGQVAIQNDLFPPDGQDASFEAYAGDYGEVSFHTRWSQFATTSGFSHLRPD